MLRAGAGAVLPIRRRWGAVVADRTRRLNGGWWGVASGVSAWTGPDRTGGGGGRPLSGSGRGRSARSTRLLIKWPPLVLLRDPAAVFGGLLIRSGWLAGRPLWSRLLQREGDLWCGGALADHESSTAACCCLSVLVVENERHEDGRSHVSRRTRASRCRASVAHRGLARLQED